MGNYENVGIHVRFEMHPIFPGAHIVLNQLYGGVIDDISSLYKDNTCNELKDNAHVLLVHMVVDTMIVPFAKDCDSTVVLPLLNKCHLKVSPGVGKPSHRLSGLNALKTVFNKNIPTATIDYVELEICAVPLYFPDSCNYQDWKLFSTTSIRTQSLPSPPDLPVTAPSVGPTAAPSVGTIAASGYTFDPRRLDPDVQEAYGRSRSGSIITLTHIKGTFLNGQRYAVDGQRLILRDGTLFLMDQGLDEKGLLCEPVVCNSDSPVAVRSWYTSLQRHPIDHGVYVHPLYLFRRGHGGSSGFKAGNEAETCRNACNFRLIK